MCKLLCLYSEKKRAVLLYKNSLSSFLQSHNDFVAILDLPEGEHQYKFFVDGQWVHDPSEVRLGHCHFLDMMVHLSVCLLFR